MLLELDHITKYYGKLQALKNVTASVRPGCVGLLGPNGAGKSTLIRTLLGLLRFQGGRARVLGLDIHTDKLSVRQRVGYLPEQDAYFPGMTGLRMVAYAAELSGLPRHEAMSRAHEVIDFAGLGEERYRQVETYSTGMRQRAKLAQALVHGPELVFLDEPTNGLDPVGREEMLSLIAELGRAGINVLLSSHLLHDVERVCDSLILMNEGEVVHYGTIAEFKGTAVRQVEIEVRGGIGREGFTQKLENLGIEVLPHEDPERLTITIHQEEDLDALWRVAVGGQCEVRHLAPCRVSLESAFLTFMKVGRNAGSPDRNTKT